MLPAYQMRLKRYKTISVIITCNNLTVLYYINAEFTYSVKIHSKFHQYCSTHVSNKSGLLLKHTAAAQRYYRRLGQDYIGARKSFPKIAICRFDRICISLQPYKGCIKRTNNNVIILTLLYELICSYKLTIC